MLLAIITAWLAYKRAKEHGRNPFLWAFIGGATFIGTQLLVSLGFGIVLGIGVEVWGWSETVYDDFGIPITIAAIVSSFLASWVLLRWLDKAPREEKFTPPPPPPQDFSSGN